MPYTIDTDRVKRSVKTEIDDMTITLLDEELKFADIESAAGDLPVITFGKLFLLLGSVPLPNKGLWLVVDASPTTSLILSRRLGFLFPETDLSIPTKAEFWMGERMLLVEGNNINVNDTEIDFADVVVMDLSKAGSAPGGDGGPE